MQYLNDKTGGNIDRDKTAVINPYPIIFSRKIKSTLWGGFRLYPGASSETAGIDGCPKVGEIWNLCENHNIVALNGGYKLLMLEDIIKNLPPAFFGVKYGARDNNDPFPFILKIIDANDRLSIQLHPNDEMARKIENYYCGKTEMWYVLDAQQDSEIILGFNQKIDEQTFRRHIKNNSLESVLNHIKVKKGDCFIIYPGTVHAIGKGVLIAEIQQNCDITYRVYDYARLDSDGNARGLHIEKAIKCVDYGRINPVGCNGAGSYNINGSRARHLNSNEYFDVMILESAAGKGIDCSFKLPVFSVFMNIGEDAFVCYGQNCCDYFPKYSALLMPADYTDAHFEPVDGEKGIAMLQAFTLPDTPDKFNIINQIYGNL
jgi:mannose-6-phosphate isomerase